MHINKDKSGKISSDFFSWNIAESVEHILQSIHQSRCIKPWHLRNISKIYIGFMDYRCVYNHVMLPFKFHTNSWWKRYKCIIDILSNQEDEPNFIRFWQLNMPKIVGYIFKAACSNLAMQLMFILMIFAQ